MERCKWYDDGICQLKSNAKEIEYCSWDEPYFVKCDDFESGEVEFDDELLEALAEKVVEILVRDGYIEKKN